MTTHPNQSLFLSKTFSDVTFIVEDQTIPAHKMLLAANCPYFETMLFGALDESKMSVIEIKSVSYKTFVEVLRCAYLRKVDISDWTPEEVKTLIQIADQYQFSEMGSVIAESLIIDTHVTLDTIEEVIGVAKRLNCNRLMERCVEAARKDTEFLFANEDAFDKLPMDFIIHLIDCGVWNAADSRLVYSIGNWRKTASIDDKKLLLSKIDWKSLPAKYSYPLVRMLLENDVDGLQVKDWTDDLQTSSAISDLITSVYLSDQAKFYSGPSYFVGFPIQCDIQMSYRRSQECVIFFFREVINISKVKFKYQGKASIRLILHGSGYEREIIGTITDDIWEFNLEYCGSFSSAALQFEDRNLDCNNKHSSHFVYDITFCY